MNVDAIRILLIVLAIPHVIIGTGPAVAAAEVTIETVLEGERVEIALFVMPRSLLLRHQHFMRHRSCLKRQLVGDFLQISFDLKVF